MKKTFIEVSNEKFERVCESALKLKDIYGTDYGTSYETFDQSKGYGHMIFKNKQEAMAYLKNKGVAVE
ncbi:hypothetical protein [Salinicoccus sp. HZC-1]|uniref:hypothetical protein n=1 Tax=Salinicoccus sp. HZC-1 TaxID=3385497 RepID=UPI00398B596A